MKHRKRVIGVLCSVIMLFAFSINIKAMEFDAEEAYNSIFVVYSGNYIGSGFAIGTNTVITNAHVIENSNDIMVKTFQGDSYRASIYLIDDSFDIAVLSVGKANFVPMEIGDCDSIKAGDEIYAIGAPGSLGYTLTKGIVSNKARIIGMYQYIQIDAAINSGNSGGPLLNAYGKVIGVNSMKISDSEGIGFAIPISSVLSFIQDNGVAITGGNNIEGELPYIENTPKEDEEEKNTINLLVLILGLCLGGSIIINIILIIIIMYRRREEVLIKSCPSERTDFEIDILE